MSNATELLTQLRAIGVQLTLDGDVLRLNAPKGSLTPELQSELKANKPALLELLRTMRQNGGRAIETSIPRVERRPLMPLSFAQQRIWFLQQMDPQSSAYNLLAAICLRGKLDDNALERSLRSIIDRHEDLRTSFVQRDGSPWTVIGDNNDWKLQHAVLDSLPYESLEAAVAQFAATHAQRPFDLGQGPLFRAYLLRSTEDEHVLIFSIHHIVTDGWSMGVVIHELIENYRAFRLNETPSLPELAIQYVDFSEWQRKWLAYGVLEKQMKYWQRQLEGAPSVVIFPPDHKRSPAGDGIGRRAKLVLSAELVTQLDLFSRGHDATLFMTLLSAFMLLLSRYSGQKDVVVGSPSANRTRAELNDLIGFFVNNLVLRVAVDDGISFLDLLQRVRESTLGASEHQDAPFDHLVRELQTDRDPEYAPLFQTMFILQNFPLEELNLPQLTVTPLEIDASTARYDLTVEIYPYHGELWVYFDYRTDLYDSETIAELQRNFEHVLRYVIGAPTTQVENVPLMPEGVREALLHRGNDTVAETPADLLLESLERNVTQTPNKIAIRAGGVSLTYAELNARANNLAHRLRYAGAGPGSLVPVCLSRSTDLLVALLGVLKTGAAYVPLDPIYPIQRIASILADVQPGVLVTEQTLSPLLGGYERRCIVIDQLVDNNTSDPNYPRPYESLNHATAEDLAYVIFTSGSTGKPKGVEISHSALANFLESMRCEPGFICDDCLLAVTTVSFDIAGLELFLPIYVGGEVVISQTPADLPALLHDLETVKPTVLQATPALWQMLISAGWQGDSSMTALCGGEALTPQLASVLAPRVKTLWNMYGPTETTIWSSVLRVDIAQGAEEGTSIPVGGPIRNTTFYVLDSQREPLPIGVAGELYIGGSGLAQGYLHRPDLTSERFVNASFLNGQRLYRTGDLVRRRRNGTLEFLGRVDFQVKLRGFRIELGEIEHALRQQLELAECVVILREDASQKELVAYVVLRAGETLAFPHLKQRLRERLPDYMVPAGLVVMERFPRLPNGKLDRSKLPAPEAQESVPEPTVHEGYISDTEAAILKIFRALLHADRIGVDQRFFDIGAHSLLLVKAHDKLRQELDPELRLVSLFQYPSIATLAAHIDKHRSSELEIAHAGK